MSESDTDKRKVSNELERLCEPLSRITGLVVRWNGQVELPTASEVSYRGLKPFSCSIHLRADLVNEDVRWRTMIHELLHSASAGYTMSNYQLYKGWEEGVVEQNQRLIRSTLLADLGIVIDERTFQEIEAESDFNTYIVALEEARLAVSSEEPPMQFYLDLLRTPMATRYTALLNIANGLSDSRRTDAFAVLSRVNSILKTRL
jgi:hypothetical protein